MGIVYRIWAFLARVLIRPFMEAMTEELKDVAHKRAGRKIDGEILEQLQQMSKERLEVLLKDKLSEVVVELQADVERLTASLGSANRGITELRRDKASLVAELTRTNKRVLVLEKQMRVHGEQPTREAPGDSQTEVVEW